MGNTLIEDKGKINLMKSFETYNTEQIIGVRGQVFFDSKLFKTIHYKLHQQNLLVKVHLMRKQLTQAELQTHTQNFQYLIDQLQIYPNLMPFRNLINFGSTQKQVDSSAECNKDYLAVSRQLLNITLEERLQSNYKLPRCLLNYYTLQLLRAVYTLHSRHLYHGHIRSSNVLLTTNDFLVLADFASYKPAFLNELEVIRNIYKSSIQKCTLAPEKYSDLQEIQSLANLTKTQIYVLQKMDMFSVGCVIAEIYTGESLFSLEQMLQYRKGEYEPQFRIDGPIGDLIKNLISIVPEQRYTAEQALQLFHNEFCSNQTYELITYIGVALNSNGYFMQPDIRVALLRKIIASVEKRNFNYSLPISLQFVNLSKFNQICKETDYPQKVITIQFSSGVTIDEVVAKSLENGQNLIQKEFKETQQDSFSVQTSMVQRLKQSIQKPMDSIFQRQVLKSSTFTQVDLRQSNQEYIILLLWLFNSMRFCRFMQTRLCGLELAEFLCQYLDDELSYTLIVPNLGYFCEDSEPQVQYYAFTIMLQIVKRIKIPLQQSKDVLIFKLYIWEQIKNRLRDMSANQQLALRIGDVAEILHKHGRTEEKIHFLQLIQKKLQEQKNNELILIISKIGEVLKYYEPNQTENILVLLISQFNNASVKIPLLEVFFDLFKYYTDSTKILLACLQINQRQDGALFHMIKFIRMATEDQLLDLDKIKQYVREVAPLILHHNKWIREEAQKFIFLVLGKLNSLDIYLFVHPHINKYLKLDVPHITIEIFEQLIQKPISSKWFDQKYSQEPKFPQQLTDRELFNYTCYYEEFYKKTKLIQESNNPVVQKNTNPTVKLNSRVNELIEAVFIANLMQLDNNNWSEFSRKGKSWDDFVNFLKSNNNIDVSGKYDLLTKKKVKYIQELQLQFQYQIPQSCTQWINLINYNIMANQITLKSQQLQVQDLQFNRVMMQYPYRPFKLNNQLVTTIPEHKGIVTSLQKFSDQRRFISGSYDGTVKIFDMRKIEEDFTNGSIASIPIKEGDINSRVTALCTIEGTESFVVGTNTGAVSLYTNDRHTSTFVKGDSEIRKIVDQENTFMYVTEKGTLTLEDVRSKNGQRFNIGRQRGLVSCMVHDNYTTLIGTINGYLMIYDIRSTMIVNLFQLLNHDDQALPIFSLQNMNRISQLDGFVGESSKLVGIGFQSNNNEVGFWDINKQNEDLNPALYLYCSDKKHPIIETPRLQSVLKAEQFINHNNNLQQQCYYDFFNKQVDLISYLKDPLTTSERSAKNKWLNNTKNLYINLRSAFESKSTVSSLICLNSKQENTFITASTDRSILSWTLNSDSQKDKSIDKEFLTNIVCSPYNSVRKYKQCPSGDVYIIQDYEFKSGNINNSNNNNNNNMNGNQNGLEHKDCITDMTYLENDNSYLITASRDHTIKIWK